MPKDLELYKAKMLDKESKNIAKEDNINLSKRG